MSLYKIIPTIFSVFGCVANSFCLTYFLLYERKGLTNKLFILLSMWDFWNSAVVTARIWTPLSAWIFMQPLYMWVTNMNHYVLVVIAWTRMVKICSPFYRINEKAVWIAMLANILYWSTVPVTFNIKGDFTANQIFHLSGWQLAKFIHDIIGSFILLLLVLFPNIVSGIKLTKPGNIVISERNVKAAKTIMIISVMFIFSNILVYLTVARNIKFLIRKNVEPLIPGFNHLLGAFFFRLLWLLNAVCDPIVFFIRNKNLRDWVLRVPNSIKNHIFSKIMARSTNQSNKAEENNERTIGPSPEKTVVKNVGKIEPSPDKTVVNNEGKMEPSPDKTVVNNEELMEPSPDKIVNVEGLMEPSPDKIVNVEGLMEPSPDKEITKNEGNIELSLSDKNTADTERNVEPSSDENMANHGGNKEPSPDENIASHEGNNEPSPDKNTANDEGNNELSPDESIANREGNIEPSPDKNTANDEGNKELSPDESIANREGNIEPQADKNMANNEGNKEPSPDESIASHEGNNEPSPDKNTANNEGNKEPSPDESIASHEGNNEPSPDKNTANNEGNKEPSPDERIANHEGNNEPSPDKNTANDEGNIEPQADKNMASHEGNNEL